MLLAFWSLAKEKNGKVSQTFVICLSGDCLFYSLQNVCRANVQDSK